MMKPGPSNIPETPPLAQTVRQRVDVPSGSGERVVPPVQETPLPSVRETRRQDSAELGRVLDDLFTSPRTPQELLQTLAETDVCARMRVQDIVSTYFKWQPAHLDDPRIKQFGRLISDLLKQVDHPTERLRQNILFAQLQKEKEVLEVRLRNLILVHLPTETHVKEASTYFQSPSFDKDIAELLAKPVVQANPEIFEAMLETLYQESQGEGQDMKREAIRRIQNRILAQRDRQSSGRPQSSTKPLDSIFRARPMS